MNFGYLNYSELDYTRDGYSLKLWDLEPFNFDIAILYMNINIHNLLLHLSSMVFYPTIGSTYFVKTRTYVALFGPHQLSIIFSGVMCLELSAL